MLTHTHTYNIHTYNYKHINIHTHLPQGLGQGVSIAIRRAIKHKYTFQTRLSRSVCHLRYIFEPIRAILHALYSVGTIKVQCGWITSIFSGEKVLCLTPSCYLSFLKGRAERRWEPEYVLYVCLYACVCVCVCVNIWRK
jgi:hypothetical protein